MVLTLIFDEAFTLPKLALVTMGFMLGLTVALVVVFVVIDADVTRFLVLLPVCCVTFTGFFNFCVTAAAVTRRVVCLLLLLSSALPADMFADE